MTKQNSTTILVLVTCIVAIIALLFFMQKYDKSSIRSGRSLPKGATQIKDVGPGWYEFTYKRQRFLLYREGIGETQRAALVRIEDE